MEYLQTYLYLVLLLMFVIALISFVKGKIQFFKKKTWIYIACLVAFSVLLGMGSVSAIEKLQWNTTLMIIIIQLIVIGLGILHIHLLFNVIKWSDENRFWLTLLINLGFAIIAGIGLYIGYTLLENQEYITFQTLGTNFALTFVGFVIPYFVSKGHQFWNEIPIIKRTYWILPFDHSAPVIQEGSRFIIIHFIIPREYESKDIIGIDARAPLDRTIGDIFHYILYRHNVEKKSYKQIEIADENMKEKVYGWLFYKFVRRWWWDRRKYLNAHLKILNSGLANGDKVYVERVRAWEY